MKLSISSRYAFRSLTRHGRRTILSVLGIALGCSVSLMMVSFVRGEGEMIMRAAAESGTGHLRVAPQRWPETRDRSLRLPRWRDILTTLRGMDGIRVAAPRARTEALLAFGTRTRGVEMVGVEAQSEPKINRLVQKVSPGRYLRPGEKSAVVIGKALAKRLDVEVGDDLMATVSGEGDEMRSAMLKIVGLVRTGSRDLDATVCHVSLGEVEDITGYRGAAELTALAEEPEHLSALVEDVGSEMPEDIAVLTWADLLPELASGVEVDETWTKLMVGLVVTVVFLGIASAQLTAVLERRREFAVLAALGMKRTQLMRIMVAEGLVLGILGAAVALALGGPATYLMSRHGIDFSGLYGDSDLAVSNILLDPVIYGTFGWWLIPLALALALGSTLLSSLYPAWYAIRTDPAQALRVEK